MFTVRLQPGGQVFTVEEQENILAEGLRQGVALPYGCRGGSCGSCAATLLQGEVDYPSGEPMGLSPYDRDQGRVLLCQAVAYSDLELDSPHVGMLDDIEVKTLPARVEKLRRLNDDVMEVTLKLPTSEHLRFQAGQYVDILLRDGRRRSFSLANAPYDDQYLELHIRHVAGGDFTGQVFSTLKEKALWRIEGPLGQFYVRDSERPMVLMAGGTGFAPIKSILEQMRASGLGRPVYFYWGYALRQIYIWIVGYWIGHCENQTYIIAGYYQMNQPIVHGMVCAVGCMRRYWQSMQIYPGLTYI